MRISRAKADDLAELAVLFGAYLDFYQLPKPQEAVEQFLSQRLAQGDSTILLARSEQGAAQGFVQLYPIFSSLALKPAWLLNDLFVDPNARRGGVAKALMNAARDYAKAQGACGLQLETARDNFAGQALYEQLGYVRDEQFYTYWLAVD